MSLQAKRSKRQQEKAGADAQALQRIQKKVATRSSLQVCNAFVHYGTVAD